MEKASFALFKNGKGFIRFIQKWKRLHSLYSKKKQGRLCNFSGLERVY